MARLGEVVGMRWRDLDTDAPGLWRWALRTQYDGEALKTERPRDVPIHPELRRILEAWRREGWSRYMGRHPRPGDFVTPRLDGSCHSDASGGAKAVHRHAVKAGVEIDGRDFHSFRRWGITTARAGGADDRYLERITHNAKGTMLDRYTYADWPELSRAVLSLRVELRVATVVELRRAAVSGGADESLLAADGRSLPEGILPPSLPLMGETGEIPAESDWRRRESNPRADSATSGKDRGRAANGSRESAAVHRLNPATAGSSSVAVPRGTSKAAARGLQLLRAAGHTEEADALERLLRGRP
jgi:hypothetical protein